jgi:hypothetical protein
VRGTKVRKSPRKCRRCHRLVSAPEEIRPGGLVCLECQKRRSRKRAKKWYDAHRQEVIDRSVAWKRAHPEKVREHRDAYLARVRSDPDWERRYVEGRRAAWREWKARKTEDKAWVEHRKALQREGHRAKRMEKGLPVREITPEKYVATYGTGYGQSTRVDSYPLKPFVEVFIRQFGENEFAELAGVSPRRLHAIIDEGANISLVTADRLCTFMGLPMSLLYEDAA